MASEMAADDRAFLTSQIPVDLFVSKKHPGLPPGTIGLADPAGNIVYKVNPLPPIKCHHIFLHQNRGFVLLDFFGNTLITLHRQDKGCWQGFKSSGATASKDLIFHVEKKAIRSDGVKIKTHLQVFNAKPNGEIESRPRWTLKGNPSQRSCTIANDNSILAQTSLMYKLCQICVGKRKFRLTIYPTDDADQSLIVALVVVFVYGNI